MSHNEKTSFGATIEPRIPLTTRDAPPSPLTTSSLPVHDESNPFYNHNAASRTSTELKTPTVYAHDVEGQRSHANLGLARTESSRPPGSDNRDVAMWPSLQSQKEKAKMAKKQKCAKSWNPMHRLGRRQKLVVAAVIALLIIGAAVGIGVGVSKAVGGGVKSATGENKPIGDNGKTQ
jgi:hypothetical protein